MWPFFCAGLTNTLPEAAQRAGKGCGIPPCKGIYPDRQGIQGTKRQPPAPTWSLSRVQLLTPLLLLTGIFLDPELFPGPGLPTCLCDTAEGKLLRWPNVPHQTGMGASSGSLTRHLRITVTHEKKRKNYFPKENSSKVFFTTVQQEPS